MIDVKQNIMQILREKRVSQKELAERLGVSANSISMTLSNNSPRLSTLERIAECLDVPLVSLLGGGDVAVVETREESKQGLYCPHCGKPLTLFVKAEEIADNGGIEDFSC